MWYGILDRGLKGSRYVVAKKVVLDQFVFAPSFLAVVISFLNLAHGKSVSQVKEKMKADYVPILKANYMVSRLYFYLFYKRLDVKCHQVKYEFVPTNWEFLLLDTNIFFLPCYVIQVSSFIKIYESYLIF